MRVMSAISVNARGRNHISRLGKMVDSHLVAAIATLAVGKCEPSRVRRNSTIVPRMENMGNMEIIPASWGHENGQEGK